VWKNRGLKTYNNVRDRCICTELSEGCTGGIGGGCGRCGKDGRNVGDKVEFSNFAETIHKRMHRLGVVKIAHNKRFGLNLHLSTGNYCYYGYLYKVFTR
jgi:hypothetical protein